MRNKERLAGALLAGAAMLGGVSSSEAVSIPVPSKTISCKTIDQGYNMLQGQTWAIVTNGAVGVMDARVDGIVQYDNDANTATVIGFKSNDSVKKKWIVTADYPGWINVLRCGANYGDTYSAVGRSTYLRDTKNNPVSRINVNWVKK